MCVFVCGNCSVVPRAVLLKPLKLRVGVCSEELCFKNSIFSTLISLTNGWPIQRGGSIHQKAIAKLIDRVNSGGWVHLFPEGRVWQEEVRSPTFLFV